jgi:hypothetical protein
VGWGRQGDRGRSGSVRVPAAATERAGGVTAQDDEGGMSTGTAPDIYRSPGLLFSLACAWRLLPACFVAAEGAGLGPLGERAREQEHDLCGGAGRGRSSRRTVHDRSLDPSIGGDDRADAAAAVSGHSGGLDDVSVAVGRGAAPKRAGRRAASGAAAATAKPAAMDRQAESCTEEEGGKERAASTAARPCLPEVVPTGCEPHSAQPWDMEALGHPEILVVDASRGYYVLNPGGDLRDTQATFEAWFAQRLRWQVCEGRCSCGVWCVCIRCRSMGYSCVNVRC